MDVPEKWQGVCNSLAPSFAFHSLVSATAMLMFPGNYLVWQNLELSP